MTDLFQTALPEYDAVDLFAGPGGWDVAARSLDLSVLGIEFDHAACETRRAAGLPTVEGDVRDYSPLDFVNYRDGVRYYPRGLIASPPCQTFSAAGKGSGRKALDDVLLLVKALEHRENISVLLSQFDDERTGLVVEPLRWALTAIDAGIPYEWIALEQVPAVLPVWEAVADVLRRAGYSVDTGKLSAEQYGVPQTRKRAILVAKLEETVPGSFLVHPAELPAPTHRPYKKGIPQDAGDPDLLPWVSMAQALGWGSPNLSSAEQEVGRMVVGFPRLSDSTTANPKDELEIDGVLYRARDFREVDEPAFVTTEKARSWTRSIVPSAQPKATVRSEDEPSPTVAFGNDMASTRWVDHEPGATEDDVRAVPRPSGEVPAWSLRPSVSDNGSAKSPPRPADEPAHTVTGKHRSAEWVEERPATTVQGDPRIWPPGHKVNQADRDRIGTDAANEKYGDRKGTGSVRVSTQEAAVLQSFPPEYPWAGTRTKQFQQIGNAIPPLLARAILSEVTNRTRPTRHINHPDHWDLSPSELPPFSVAGDSPTTTSPTPPSADSTNPPGRSSSAPGSTSSTGSDWVEGQVPLPFL